ncbi:DUF2388 domain-containing protein [Azomonas macrocytogenes]|uniref:Uncharacterized protein (TIGR02448 family) n=1 Tax=Azomonas macrocytogenes TaxID=69962 RepID=A0A839T3V6_AZOMA|nr:DUF2388 domain-containing protein [Azomonas macrocytogenes]MBB3102635.1 uncharacterized protein (TIGR02448 family) [Azomonas macrocytogenes]
MHNPRVLLAVALAFVSAATMADDGWVRRILSSGATTASTYLTSRDDKQVAAIREEASGFVASNGEIRGPFLEAKLQQLRSEHPELQASDLELATTILVGEQ